LRCTAPDAANPANLAATALTSDPGFEEEDGMAEIPASVVAAGGLIGGYGVARWTRKRALGGVALAAAGTFAARDWHARSGPGVATALTTTYLAAFAGAHPLARKLGAWPAVFAVASGVAAASWAVSDRHR
jgi:hypothetical protein